MFRYSEELKQESGREMNEIMSESTDQDVTTEMMI